MGVGEKKIEKRDCLAYRRGSERGWVNVKASMPEQRGTKRVELSIKKKSTAECSLSLRYAIFGYTAGKLTAVSECHRIK